MSLVGRWSPTQVIANLSAGARGILAADEDPGALDQRMAQVGLPNTLNSRRAYREWMLNAPGLSEHVAGVILNEETLRQRDSEGRPFAERLLERGILPGLKMDRGRRAIPGSPREMLTLGLDDLPTRLERYRDAGIVFVKWRAAFVIDGTRLPSPYAVAMNSQALAAAAAISQEAGLIPIVEPDVQTTGPHDLARCYDASAWALDACFSALGACGVDLRTIVLKTNMVTAGSECPHAAAAADVADQTLRCLQKAVPATVPLIALLSGGRSFDQAVADLQAIGAHPARKTWKIGFAFGRALRDEAFGIWAGQDSGVTAAQHDLVERAARCADAAFGVNRARVCT